MRYNWMLLEIWKMFDMPHRYDHWFVNFADY